MGMCKGCGTVVTSLYCYAHRVNVCENCMVQQHPRCLVRTYMKWLEDVDTNSNCSLCRSSFDEGEVIRLVCLDLFHLDCLRTFTNNQPADSVPNCPICFSPIIPPKNNVSPIADALRAYLPILCSGTTTVIDLPDRHSSVNPIITRSRDNNYLKETKPLSPTHHSVNMLMVQEQNYPKNETFQDSFYENKYEKRVKNKLGSYRAPWKRTYTSSSICKPKILKFVCLCILFIIIVFTFSHFLASARKKVTESEFIQSDFFLKVGQDT